MIRNRKGYMLVELVLASALAMSIAFYLLNLTYQFKNKNEDIHQSIAYMSDKIAITKNIMNDLDRVIVTDINHIHEENENTIDTVELVVRLRSDYSNRQFRRLQIIKNVTGIAIQYGKWENDHFIKEDFSYYEKSLEKSLIVKKVQINGSDTEEDFFSLKIPIRSMYDDKNYDINLLIQRENMESH